MKTTLELPDDLLRRSKATAALRGESLEDFVAGALRERLKRQAAGSSGEPGWHRVFGKARRADVAAVDTAVEEHFERVDPNEWR